MEQLIKLQNKRMVKNLSKSEELDILGQMLNLLSKKEEYKLLFNYFVTYSEDLKRNNFENSMKLITKYFEDNEVASRDKEVLSVEMKIITLKKIRRD